MKSHPTSQFTRHTLLRSPVHRFACAARERAAPLRARGPAMSESTAAVLRRSVVTEAAQALRRLSRVRLDWSAADALGREQAAAEDPVGFVFADALPPRALLLEVNHVGFLWCAIARRAARSKRTPRRAAPAVPHSAPARRRPRRLTCCVACFVTGAFVTGWLLWRIFQRRLELLVRIRAAACVAAQR